MFIKTVEIFFFTCLNDDLHFTVIPEVRQHKNLKIFLDGSKFEFFSNTCNTFKMPLNLLNFRLSPYSIKTYFGPSTKKV